MAIRAGQFPPLRAVASWDGRRTLYRCDVCDRPVASSHIPGGPQCHPARQPVEVEPEPVVDPDVEVFDDDDYFDEDPTSHLSPASLDVLADEAADRHYN